MSKLSFRARALDAARPMAVFLGEELPDLPDHSAISRAVPAMPTGMEKDEECEHHLQRAICAGLIIPTPEVAELSDASAYERLYPPDYAKPRQLIHMQPLGLEQEVPDYDMDSEDERWLRRQHAAAGGRANELTELKFEETMEKLERGSGQTVVTLKEARALAGKSGPADHLLAAVYDYWLNKRLATQRPLLLAVRTEPRPGAPAASPYLAFRRRTEKMQTRKNRKNDESSYEKMVKLRRELERVATLLAMIRQREKVKKEYVSATASIAEKRFVIKDFGGSIVAEAKAQRATIAPSMTVPAFPVPHYRSLDSATRQRDRRQYKKRKHRHHSSLAQSQSFHHGLSGSSSSSEGESNEIGIAPPVEASGPFTFHRKPGCQYHMPTSFDNHEDMPWMLESCKENAHPSRQHSKHKYSLASISHPRPRCVGFVRRRMGRGGRVILDRLTISPGDDRLWESLGYTVTDSKLQSTPSPTDAILDTSIANIKCEEPPALPNCSRPKQDDAKVKSDAESLRLSSDFADVTIKRELDESEFSDSEKLSRLDSLPTRSEVSNADGCTDETSDSDSLSSCDEHNIYNSKFSFKGSAQAKGRVFRRYREKSLRIRNKRRAASGVYREDMKVIAELLVARRLAHYERRVPDVSSESLDNFLTDVWGNRLHFKPNPSTHMSPAGGSPKFEEETEQLTERSPITVHVRLALPDIHQPPSDLLSNDSSAFVTSEFTLADIYGDSIIEPNPEVDPLRDDQHRKPINEDVSWNRSNGPSKPSDAMEVDLSEATPTGPGNVGDSKIIKGESAESSSTNRAAGSDSLAFRVTDDSNRESANGIILELNESIDKDKIRHTLVRKSGNGLANRCKSSVNSVDANNHGSVVKVESLLGGQKIYIENDRPASPAFSILPAGLQNRLSNQTSPEKSEQKRSDALNQNLAIVQLKTPTALPQSKVKQVLKGALTGGGAAESRAPLLVAHNSAATVQKTVDGIKFLAKDDVLTGIGPQQQQLVTLNVSDSFKLRLPSRILSNSSASAGTSAHELLGLVQHKNVTANSVSKDGVTNAMHRTLVHVGGGTSRPVRLVPASSLSPSQRTKLIKPGSVKLHGLTNLFQVQMKAPMIRTEAVEGVALQPIEAVSAGGTASSAGEAATPGGQPPTAAGAPPSSSGTGKPPPQPAQSSRKGQASLPMEVT